jgi:hypothetical protein
VKATSSTAMKPTTSAVLGERRNRARDGKCRQCSHYDPTQFSSYHDSSPPFSVGSILSRRP